MTPWFEPREPMNAQVVVWAPPDLTIRYLEHERRIALSRKGNNYEKISTCYTARDLFRGRPHNIFVRSVKRRWKFQ